MAFQMGGASVEHGRERPVPLGRFADVVVMGFAFKFLFYISLLVLALGGSVFASPPGPLGAAVIPPTPGLLNGPHRIVVNRQAAIVLGKALFWDTSVGSDGIACGSCHFHAGADRRTRNQLSTGHFEAGSATSASFEPTASGQAGGVDYQLRSSDFPLHQFWDTGHRISKIIFSTDDVVGSSGTFLRNFERVDTVGSGVDQCAAASDDLFHLDVLNTRRVTDRNAPSVINAAFNFRNFWDGRANNLFNGESAFGPRDPQAGVWINVGSRPVKRRLLLKNASLASLAVAPPLNAVEMSCVGRVFPALGRKLLQRSPLQNQAVAEDDSVLGSLRDSDGVGLATTYGQLVQKAFARRFWSLDVPIALGGEVDPYTQMEANFAFFFGLAIQLYEQTLVADQSLFDTERDDDNVPVRFNDQQRRGLDVFMTSQCPICHFGSNFTAATHPQAYSPKYYKFFPMVERSRMFQDLDKIGVAGTLFDRGFLPTSVAPPEHDVGLAGTDPWGNPLSFSEQYLATLAGSASGMIDPLRVVACDLEIPFNYDFGSSERIPDPNGTGYCRGYRGTSSVPSPAAIAKELAKPLKGRAMTTVKAAFKIPGLRNVELTGPYMHNGSMKSLQEVVQFYDRGGNGFGNPQHPETLVFLREFSEAQKADLVAFLKTLTDERVRWERAPFDHPEILIPEGHEDQPHAVLGAGFATDRLLHIPAVGKNGRSVVQGPLLPFESYLEP